MVKEITSNDFSEIRWRGNWIWVLKSKPRWEDFSQALATRK